MTFFVLIFSITWNSNEMIYNNRLSWGQSLLWAWGHNSVLTRQNSLLVCVKPHTVHNTLETIATTPKATRPKTWSWYCCVVPLRNPFCGPLAWLTWIPLVKEPFGASRLTHHNKSRLLSLHIYPKILPATPFNPPCHPRQSCGYALRFAAENALSEWLLLCIKMWEFGYTRNSLPRSWSDAYK